jgi:3-oxoacyl-[acyl-carrier protein] reductase
MTGMERPVALVTGGSRGIGRATVLRLAQAGYDVGFCYRSRAAEAAEVERAAVEHGAAVLAAAVDVTDAAGVTTFVRRVEDELGPLTAVVTSAGVTCDRSLLAMSDDDWAVVLRTNVDGTFHACRAALFGMLKRRRGAVVTLSSAVGRYGNAGQTNYAASKAAITAFTKATAKEVGRFGIRANAVAPGLVETDMTGAMSEKALSQTLPKIPLGRIGTAEEVAELVEFLLSGRAAYITGQLFGIDGGLVL